MQRKVGVWIDHRKAVLVFIEGGAVAVKTVLSGMEKRVRMAGGARSRTQFGPREIASESRRDRRYEKQLGEYYAEVLELLGAASGILVFGPGEAKREFLARIESSVRYRDTTTELEAADKMTEKEILAAVRKHFG